MNLRKAMLATVACTFVASVALAEGAAVNVKVNWEGKRYKPKVMKEMNKECTGFHADGKPPRRNNVITNENGTLRNVFVYVKNAPEGNFDIAEPVMLDQVGCVYVPRVLGVMVGQTLKVRNSDPTAHNVHFTPQRNQEFNKSQPKKDLVEELTFRRAEIMVPVKCDVHPWMGAHVGVLDHPFGTTREDGTVKIEGLPGGTYTIIAWHEKYGEKEIEVTVETNGSADGEFTYSRADK